jgi:hypothetical protein
MRSDFYAPGQNQVRKRRNATVRRSTIISFVVFICFCGILLHGIADVSAASRREQLRVLSRATVRAAVQCYAIEGRYPPSIAYLEENYGLLIDHQRYLVTYNSFASNLMPEITVIDRQTGDFSMHS